MTKAPAAITDWQTLPLMLTLQQIADIHGLSVATVCKRVRAGSFRPMPVSDKPLRWSRAECQRVWEGN